MLEVSIEAYVEKSEVGLSVKLAADYLDITQAQVHALLKKGTLKRARVLGNHANYNQVETTSVITYYLHTHGTEDQYQRLMKRLEAAARSKQLVEYNDAMVLCDLDHTLSLHRAIIGRLLGKASRASMKEKDVMLSAVVVLKTTGIPSSSFFEFAQHLEVPGADLPEEEFHKLHIKKVFKAYHNTMN